MTSEAKAAYAEQLVVERLAVEPGPPLPLPSRAIRDLIDAALPTVRAKLQSP